MRRRLDLWERKDLESLFDEGECLQQHFCTTVRGGLFLGEEDAAQKFGNCMSAGRVHQAIRMLPGKTSSVSGVLQLDEVIILKDGKTASVKELLEEKHGSNGLWCRSWW